MNSLKTCIILFLCSSCAKTVYLVPEEFKPYVNSFQTYYNHSFDNVQYALKDLNSEQTFIIGTCYPKHDSGYIEIDNTFWKDASESSKEEVMFHELGHCVLHRAHRNDYNGDVPVSIMDWQALRDDIYDKYKTDYINELFNHLNPQLNSDNYGILEEKIIN